jgi:hypothetical protein
METLGKIVATDLDFLYHKPKITIQIDNQRIIATDEYSELCNADKLEIKIEKYIDKRGTNANSALWVLCNKIANKLGTTKEEMYIMELKKYGQSFLVPLTPGINPKGYFKYYDFREKGEINGKQCNWYVVYKGSSEYNKEEMRILLEGVNNDCKDLGLETIEDFKMKKLIEEWE